MTKQVVPESWFKEWRDPRIFYRKVDECMGQFKPDVLLGMSGVQHLFDAFVGGLFARIWNDHSPCEIRLVDDAFPDAELRDADGILGLEVTMADRKDRKMAVEHRERREIRERGET